MHQTSAYVPSLSVINRDALSLSNEVPGGAESSTILIIPVLFPVYTLSSGTPMSEHTLVSPLENDKGPYFLKMSDYRG